MKKILLYLLLLCYISTFAQAEFPEGIQVTNVQDNSALKVNVQNASGVINWKYLSDFQKEKAILSTGLIKNGLIQANGDPTKFNITSGTGIISNFDDPENPISTLINFPAFTAVTPTYLLTGTITYVAINSTPSVVMQATPFTPEQRRSLIVLGAVVHSNLSTINVLNNISAPSNASTNQLHDFIEAVGALNITGNKYTANGANLQLNKSAGTIFKLGVNFANDWKNPHTLGQSVMTSLTFRYRTQNGTEGSDRINLNPALYDNNNVLTAVPNNKFTIQTVTMFQSGLTRIQYGQTIYDDLSTAKNAIFTRNFVLEPNSKENGIIRAYIIMRNTTTSLQTVADAEILEAQKFGGVASGGVALTLANIVTAIGYTPENVANKQNSLTADGTGIKYPTVDAVNTGLALKANGFLNIPDGTNVVDFTIDGVNARVTTSANYSKSGEPKKLAVFFHYYGGNYTTMPSAVLKDSLLNNGYSIATISAGDTWGNEKSQQRYASLYNYVLKKFNVEQQPIAVSSSMGTLTALNSVSRKTIPFRAMISVVGVVNLAEYYGRSIGTGTDTSIQNAYNFATPSDSTKSFFGFNPYTRLKKNFGDLTYPISCPIYFVNGDLDTSTPLIFTNDIYGALNRDYSNSIIDITAGGTHDVEMVTTTIANNIMSWLIDNNPLYTRTLPDKYPLLEVNNGIRMRDKLLGSSQLNYVNFEKQDGTSRGLFGYLLPDVIGIGGMSWVNKEAGIGIYGSDASSVLIGVVNSLGDTTNLIEGNVLGGKHLYFNGQSDTSVDTNVKIQMKSGGVSEGILKWVDNGGGSQNAFFDAFDYRFRMSGTDKVVFSNLGAGTFSSSVTASLFKSTVYTVATLPTPPSTGTGTYATVSDALAPSYMVTVVGGGAVVTPVFYNGTNWVAH